MPKQSRDKLGRFIKPPKSKPAKSTPPKMKPVKSKPAKSKPVKSKPAKSKPSIPKQNRDKLGRFIKTPKSKLVKSKTQKLKPAKSKSQKLKPAKSTPLIPKPPKSTIASQKSQIRAAIAFLKRHPAETPQSALSYIQKTKNLKKAAAHYNENYNTFRKIATGLTLLKLKPPPPPPPPTNFWNAMVLRFHPPCSRKFERISGNPAQRAWVGQYINVKNKWDNAEEGQTPAQLYDSIFVFRDKEFQFRSWARRVRQYFNVSSMYFHDFSSKRPFWISFDLYFSDDRGARVAWAQNLAELAAALIKLADSWGHGKGNTPTEEDLVIKCIKPRIALQSPHRFIYRPGEIGKRRSLWIQY